MGVTRLVSYLPLHTLVLVVEAVVMTAAGVAREKSRHLVLVQIHIAGVGVRIFVVNVELTALAAARLLFAVFRKIHSRSLKQKMHNQRDRRDNCAYADGDNGCDVRPLHLLFELAHHFFGFLFCFFVLTPDNAIGIACR